MPKHLSGKQVSACYKRATIGLFFSGLAINIITPLLYWIYSFKVNDSIPDGKQALFNEWYQDRKALYAGFYGAGCC